MGTAERLVPVPWQVRERREDTAEVVSLLLEPASPAAASSPLPAPGQFAMLWVFGVGEAPVSYAGGTLGGPALHTIRRAGNVTRALCALGPGETVGVRGPFGRGWPLDGARGRDLLLLAGGIGLAPLRPVLETVAARREDFGRVTLLYGARRPEDLLFRDEFEDWRGRAGADVEITVDAAAPPWTGRVGVVTDLLAGARFRPEATEAFVCGPELMMRFAAAALRASGIPDAAIHLSMERNMQCAVGLCGHCQWGEDFLCREGPVLPLDRIAARLAVREY
jgi:NAD(P)H-flavin reductase